MMYEYYEPNNLHKKKGVCDCVIRACTKALNKDWFNVFDEMNVLARSLMTVLNDSECYIKYIESYGFKKYSLGNLKGRKRPTVRSFAKEHKEGTYILKVASHIVCCKDGKYYDRWDSGDCCLYNY